MLIGESGDTQPVCLRALNNARPIHLHRDVRVPNLLERRVKISMSRADLNVPQKFSARISVIDRDHISTLHVRCDIVDPVKRCLVKNPFIPRQPGGSRSLMKGALNENKYIAR